jgi:hypothetical protein
MRNPSPKYLRFLARALTAGARDGDGDAGGKMLATGARDRDGEEDTRSQDAPAALLQLLVLPRRSSWRPYSRRLEELDV